MTYWEKRQQELNRAMEKDEAALKKRLSSYFDTEFARLDREIAAYYQRYGVDNVIQYRTLMESLSEADRRLLMEEMDKFAARYPEYAHLMPVRESIYRLNRLEGLQYSIRMQQIEIGAVENKEITAYLNKQAERGVNAAAEALGFGKNFYANNPDISKLFVNTAWSNGQNFSQRIWGNTSKLAEYLNTDIAQGIARGDSYDRLVRQLRARFGKVSRNDAYRLIYTEGTYVMAESSMQPFLEDFEQYRLSTVGDGKVCEICREVAKHVFDIKDRKPGTNFPPLHPWCRCTFTIEVADWDKWMEDYERRHGNGQAEKVANRLSGPLTDEQKKNKTIKKKEVPENQNKTRNLSQDEKGAIIRYVGPDSYALNDKLRRRAENELSELEKEWMKNLDSALEKLPNYQGDLNRSLIFASDDEAKEFYDSFTVNKEYIPSQYLSTTKQGVYNDEGQVQIYIQNTKMGKDLEGLNDMENEVLYPLDSKFKVVNKTEQDGKFWILLEEAE